MDHICKGIRDLLADGNPHLTADIVHATNQPKWVVNQKLYSMERDGALERVCVSPPSWQLPAAARTILLTAHNKQLLDGISTTIATVGGTFLMTTHPRHLPAIHIRHTSNIWKCARASVSQSKEEMDPLIDSGHKYIVGAENGTSILATSTAVYGVHALCVVLEDVTTGMEGFGITQSRPFLLDVACGDVGAIASDPQEYYREYDRANSLRDQARSATVMALANLHERNARVEPPA